MWRCLCYHCFIHRRLRVCLHVLDRRPSARLVDGPTQLDSQWCVRTCVPLATSVPPGPKSQTRSRVEAKPCTSHDPPCFTPASTALSVVRWHNCILHRSSILPTDWFCRIMRLLLLGCWVVAFYVCVSASSFCHAAVLHSPCSRSYCPSGSSSPLPVGVGNYTYGGASVSTQTAQAVCPPPTSAVNNYSASYCPGTGDGGLYTCPAGVYGNASGLTSRACSGNCAPGYYCPPGSSSPTAVPCGNVSVYVTGVVVVVVAWGGGGWGAFTAIIQW